MNKVSLILPAFKRADLLDLGLYSISLYKYNFPLEIIVVNDGIEDDTKSICDKYSDKLDIKYYFSGQRNTHEIKKRCPAWAINIGVKKCSGDIIVLSCPEIWYLNDCLNYIVQPILITGNRIMTTPNSMYFDDNNYLLHLLQTNKDILITQNILDKLVMGGRGLTATRMPFLMGMYKKEFMYIGGYDEDFIGYAGDDNDFADRLSGSGLNLLHVDAKIVHLYHGGTNNGQNHLDNPAWVYNYNLWQGRKGILRRNENREWGVL